MLNNWTLHNLSYESHLLMLKENVKMCAKWALRMHWAQYVGEALSWPAWTSSSDLSPTMGIFTHPMPLLGSIIIIQKLYLLYTGWPDFHFCSKKSYKCQLKHLAEGLKKAKHKSTSNISAIKKLIYLRQFFLLENSSLHKFPYFHIIKVQNQGNI